MVMYPDVRNTPTSVSEKGAIGDGHFPPVINTTPYHCVTEEGAIGDGHVTVVPNTPTYSPLLPEKVLLMMVREPTWL